MKCAQLLISAAVIAITLSAGTASFAKGGGHGGHGGHAHAATHRAGAAHSFANHGRTGGGAHFGANHHFAHNQAFAHNHGAVNRAAFNRRGWNHGAWNHGGWPYGWGGRGYGWGYGSAWGYAGWRGRGYGGIGPVYVASGIFDPSYYYAYGVTNPRLSTTNRSLTGANLIEVIEPVAPVVPPLAPADPDEMGPRQSLVDSTAAVLASESTLTLTK